ncbi:MAG: hypothetical protein LH615_16220 [Ferruginibacter sp.]|nr:hypothetical protein [Ferruginibacter sp.]
MLQELMVYAGTSECYEKCNEVIDKFIDIKVSAAQVYRVTDCYGKEAAKLVNATRTLEPVKKQEVLYAEVDGSMIQTVTEGWKEVKVGRLFTSGSCIDPNGKASWIRHSQYAAQLGGCIGFENLMENIIDNYGNLGQRLVFINDGAIWIKNWIEDAYPQAVSVLDYYHACEHLYQFTEVHFKDKLTGQNWAEAQKELMLNSEVGKVIKHIRQLKSKNNEAEKLINYYQSNINRMDYVAYKKIGAGIIGSGAIESAHRTVVQKRMKLSGQRWTIEGAQHLLNLRVIKMNEQWSKIIGLTKSHFKKIAA